MLSPAPAPLVWHPELALLGVALVWGATFVMVKDAVAIVAPLTFLAIRFIMATIAMALVYRRRLFHLDAAGWRDGVMVGVFLLAGYALQTAGLQWTTAGRAGFLTGLAVILVPFTGWAWLRRRPRATALVGATIAVAGLALLLYAPSARPTDASPATFGVPPTMRLPALDELVLLNFGDLLVLGCALSFALHITAITAVVRRAATRYDPAALATVQIATTAIMCVAGAAAFEGATLDVLTALPTSVWFAAAFTGLLATAVAFGVQSAAQATITPERTALIFASEPVFAALFAWLLAGEQLGPLGWAGGALIVVAMVIGGRG